MCETHTHLNSVFQYYTACVVGSVPEFMCDCVPVCVCIYACVLRYRDKEGEAAVRMHVYVDIIQYASL